ncbi:unnamed protein product [Miscanthus lutarioriparius]|uniref:Uncharacterized protein n=1 Tax=Miscanthus lutarioriparius TaxID=422564 RepID=A0A811R5M0_9POAL|nr:unnamed protein product [Miscanthus lutarioriparius]
MEVDVVGTTLVAPSEDTPRRELWVSNLDLAVPKAHTPLAGRLGVGEGGRLQIDCNAQGALFVVARGQGRLRRRGRVRSPDQGSNQICGITLEMENAESFEFAIMTTSVLAFGSRDGSKPMMHRAIRSSAWNAISVCRSWATAKHARPLLYLLADVKSRCAPGVSTYCAVTAHLWRCMCVARGLAPGSDTRLHVPANVRHRLRPPLQRSYFGNAIVRDLVVARVEDVLARPLGFVAQAIRDAVDRVDDAYVRSVVNYLEVESEKGSQAARGQLMPESDLWVVSWLGMPMYDADFGWGPPRFVARRRCSAAARPT